MVRGPQFSCQETSGTDTPPPPGDTSRTAPAKAPKPARDLFASAEVPTPTERPLKIYAFDPSAGRYVGNYMTALVRYEKLSPGPIGKRFAVIDYDGANKTFYRPVNLDDPRLLITAGLAPSEPDPPLPSADGLCGRERDPAAV